MSAGGLQRYTDMLADKYSSLFSLPSKFGITVTLLAICVAGSAVVILPLEPSLGAIPSALLFGVMAFTAQVASEALSSGVFFSSDPVLNMKRCLGASLFSSPVYFSLTGLGVALSLLTGNLDVAVKLSLVGASSTLALRLLAFSWLSSSSKWRVAAAALTQPLLCYALTAYLAYAVMGVNLHLGHLSIAALSAALLSAITLASTQALGKVGEKFFGVSSVSIARAFFASWMENLNAPLEAFFERMGREEEVDIAILAFKGLGGNLKALVVVPEIHPGPYKDLGSSCLPGEIKEGLEGVLGCPVAVPHGLSGHELNLASKLERRRVVKRVLEDLNFSDFRGDATPFIRVEHGDAKVGCQIFGDLALLTLTLAPTTMEDLPRGLKNYIIGEARKRGLSTAIAIDSHNCINGPFDRERATRLFREACVKALEECLAQPRLSLEVGAAGVVPPEFSVRDGMGPGGIVAVVVRVGGQTTAYVTIDGNNMVVGLREKILAELKRIGVDDGEVLTTDTHVVGGRATVERGYHPVGEAMDVELLLNYIRGVVEEAMRRMEPAEASYLVKRLRVKVMGEKQMENLCILSLQILGMAKKLAVTLIPITYLFLLAISLV